MEHCALTTPRAMPWLVLSVGKMWSLSEVPTYGMPTYGKEGQPGSGHSEAQCEAQCKSPC